MVDEADKAQLEVVCVLKGIIDGELALPDGRVIRNRPANFDSHNVFSHCISKYEELMLF